MHLRAMKLSSDHTSISVISCQRIIVHVHIGSFTIKSGQASYKPIQSCTFTRRTSICNLLPTNCVARWANAHLQTTVTTGQKNIISHLFYPLAYYSDSNKKSTPSVQESAKYVCNSSVTSIAIENTNHRIRLFIF